MKNTPRRAPTLWTKSRGPILARAHTLQLAQAINGLLVSPIAVLPQSEDEPVRPFQIGIRTQIEERLKPEADTKALNGALRRYAYSYGYTIACAQPDAMRHDLDGRPVETVSEADRMVATTRLLANIERRRQKAAGAAEREDDAGDDGTTTA